MRAFFHCLMMLGCAWLPPVHAGCLGTSPNLTAADASYAEINNCLVAAVDGDTINIPAGTKDHGCAFPGPANALATSKAVTIIGAGQGVTNLTNACFQLTTSLGKNTRLSGLSITGTSTNPCGHVSGVWSASGVAIGGDSQTWRIDHVDFNSTLGVTACRSIWISPASSSVTWGVIDHNTFNDIVAINIHIRGGNNVTDGGNIQWNRAQSLGGTEAVYIEDNSFNQTAYLGGSAAALDADAGARFVFRYNTVKNNYLEQHDAIIVNMRGVRQWEVYNNTFNRTTSTGGQSTFLHMRGGVGVAFNNTSIGLATDNSPMQMHLYRKDGTNGGDPWTAQCSNTTGKACLASSSTYPRACTTDANCSSITGACIDIDTVGGSPAGYPCRDQGGWDGNATRTSMPLLFWNNKTSGGSDLVLGVGGAGAYTSNVDYCYSSTSKPTTCNGITVNTYYPGPLIHPHPLITGGSGSLPAPTTGPSHHTRIPERWREA